MLMLLAAAVFAAAALQSAVQLASASPERKASFLNTREAEVVHLLMNAAMAFMLTPAYGAAARDGVAAALAAAIVLLVASLWVRPRGDGRRWALSRRTRLAGVSYHGLMVAAMIYAMFLMAPGAMSSGGIASMSPGMAGMAMTTPARRWLSLPRVLALVFALDALIGAVAVVAFPIPLIESERRGNGARVARLDGDGERRLVRQLRIGLLPHLVMDLGMTWMLISA